MRTVAQSRTTPALTVMIVLSCLRALTQVPVNDAFDSRLPLGRVLETVTATNTWATAETNEPAHRGSPAVRSLWWRWTAPVDGYVVVTTTNSPSLTRVDVYDYTKQLVLLHEIPLLSESAFPIAVDRYEFSAFQGLDYNLAVDGRSGDGGIVQLDLKVYTTPEILVQPLGAILTAGQRASISVRALGRLPLTYQWQFSTLSPNAGFTNLAGAVNRQLDIGTFGVVAKTDEGWYRVIIQNDYGTVMSSSVRIDVNECAIPNALQPSTVSTNVGKTVALSASALGTQPFYFQWQFKAVGQSDFADLVGITASNLVQTNISTDQGGEYRFLVSNVACTNQPSASVTVAVSTNNPLILDGSLPANLTVITNQNARFSVQVLQGYQPIWLQWWFTSLAGLTTPLVGETAPDLVLPGVQLNQAGLYWATASNRYAVVSSPQALLNVELRPPNDNFQNRIPFFPQWTNIPTVGISRTNVHGSNKNGTAEIGEPPHQDHGPNVSVWWSFTAPVDGHLIVNLTAPGAPQVLAAYTGTAVNQLSPVPNRTNRLDQFDFVATNRVEYFFAVESQSTVYSQNIGLDLIFNTDIGAPIILKEPKEGGFEFVVLGDGDGTGGCRAFDALTVVATSLDGVVYYQWQVGPTTNGPFIDIPGMTNSTLVLPNVTASNQGWYRAVVSNRSSSRAYTVPVHLTVEIGPLIAPDGQPQSVTSNACTSAKFKVNVQSCSPVTYQWRKNGLGLLDSNTEGAATDSLIITNLTPANAGTYDVVVQNSNLSITSAVATLTVPYVPTIAAQPQPSAKHGCEAANFAVLATNDCPLSYQWFFQGLPRNGAISNTLNLLNLSVVDAGDYFVVVSTPFTSVTSQVARLTVLTAPSILTSPMGQNVRACDIVNLAVEAQAEPPCSWLAYQWQLAGTNILNATNRTYSFEAQAETAGDYRVVVSNRWTSITSAVASVAVDARPIITSQPANYQRVREGDSFTNTIGVSICGVLNFQWQFQQFGGGTFSNVAVDTRHILTSNGWLIVQNAQTNESGYYRVILSNIYSNTTSGFSQVRVVRPPPNDNFVNAISLGGGNQATTSGYNEFATAEPGEPQHGLQNPSHSVWWFWTNPFPSLVTVDLAGSDIDTLLGVYIGATVSNLTTISEDDDGGANGRSRVTFMAGGGKALYFAVDGKRGAEGTNLILSVTTAGITSPPIITQQPVNLAASIGETVIFTNLAYGSPDMTIQWFGKGVPVQGATQIVGLTNYLSTLTLSNVTTNDDGVYYVVLSNSFGSVTSKLATLTFGSIVRGMVTDATKTTPDGAAVGIPGVLVSVGDVSTITDEFGNYELVGVKIGDLRADFMANKTRARLNEGVQFWNRSTLTAALLTATKVGFYDYVDDQFDVGPGLTVAKRFSMSPIFEGLRFVLNWTNKPADLDLLLHFPPAVPVSYPWIDYLLKNRGSDTLPPFALRDADMTQGWGPETITIHRFYPGTYSLYARKYPGEGGYFLTQSDARVVAYLGSNAISDASTQLKPYGFVAVPNQGTNDWWHICDIDGSTTNITWVNELLPAAPAGLAPEAALAPQANQAATALALPSPKAAPLDAAYEWNFGDGSLPSNQYEPVHGYADPGWKTVSLKITQGIGNPSKSNTLTRTNYIYVENLPPVVVITNPLPDTIFRAGDPITLQSAADGIDDPIRQVDYYRVDGPQPTFLGTTTNAPYTLVFPNTDYLDQTNVFVALARDMHGAATWSAPVAVRIYDLRGDILIIRNFPSAEIDTMAAYLDQPMIPATDQSGQSFLRNPIVKVLDHEGLYFGLVQDFKLIIWDDQGQTVGGLTDNDVAVLAQAYDSGIPLYLIGENLGESRQNLTDLQRYYQWTDLMGSQAQGSIAGPVDIQGIMTTDEDGLFYGWDRDAIANTDLPYSSNLERLSLLTNSLDVVAEVPIPGLVSSTPIMLRYPSFTEPDFGQTRRLIQDFRVASDQSPPPPDSAASAYDRQILFINGVAWLLRLFECQEIYVGLNCLQPPLLAGSMPDSLGRVAAGKTGQPMSFVTMVSQNGDCTAGGVLITNHLSSHLQVASAAITGEVDASTCQITITNNSVILRISELPDQANYQLSTIAIPRRGGWLTNEYTATRGLYSWPSCRQVAFIDGPACNGPFRLAARIDGNKVVHLTVTGGVTCGFQIQSSTDQRHWDDMFQIQPDHDPYDVILAQPSEAVRFYRLRTLE